MGEYTPHKVIPACITLFNDDGEPVEEFDIHIDSHLLKQLTSDKYPGYVPYLRDAVVWMLNQAGDHRMSYCRACGSFYDAPYEPSEPGSFLNDAFGICPACVPSYQPPRREPVYEKQRIAPALRKAVFERDAYRCRQCGGWDNLSADHVTPESKGGPTTLENLQTLCRVCNSRKGTRV